MAYDLIELGWSIIGERRRACRYKGVEPEVLEQMAEDCAERLDNITAALLVEEVHKAGKAAEFKRS